MDQITRKGINWSYGLGCSASKALRGLKMLLTVAAVGEVRLAGNQGTLTGNAGQMEEARS